MRRLFRRIAALVVTVYANRIYKQAVENADKRHKAEKVMIYVASATFQPDKLVTYDRWQFKAEKATFGYLARRLTLQTMKAGCYYHTADTAGNQAMTDREKERRRLAFIRERLMKAKLL